MIGLASDFDGTLFFPKEKETIRKSDRFAIEEFQRKGNLFGICTGRPLEGLLQSLEDRIECDFYILSTGAVILDKNKNVLFQKTMDIDIAYSIYSNYGNDCKVFFQADQKVFTLTEPLPFAVKQIRIDHFDELKSKTLIALAIQCKSVEHSHIVASEIESKYNVSCACNGIYVDVIPYGCSKGKAIQELKKILKIDKIMAIGDEHNDISMLEKADTSFSFTYSPDIVKEASNYIVETMKEALDIIKTVD